MGRMTSCCRPFCHPELVEGSGLFAFSVGSFFDLNLALCGILRLTVSVQDRLWLFLATLGYLASAGWGLYALGSQRPVANRWTFLLIGMAFILQTLFLHQRAETIRHCPITNLFETLAFFSWSLALTYIMVGPAYRMSILGAFTAPIVFLI